MNSHYGIDSFFLFFWECTSLQTLAKDKLQRLADWDIKCFGILTLIWSWLVAFCGINFELLFYDAFNSEIIRWQTFFAPNNQVYL